MKKKNVIALLYKIRVEIIEEIETHERDREISHEMKSRGGYEYGYDRGLSEAAMIMLDRMEKLFPEEFQEEDE